MPKILRAENQFLNIEQIDPNQIGNGRRVV